MILCTRITVMLMAATMIAFVVTPTISSQDAGQDEEQKLIPPKVEMLTTRVLVLDPDRNPVEGATVYCTGLRTKIERGSHWMWSPELHGTLPKLKTNRNGIANMPYPKYVAEKLETGTMTWSVEHPDFVDFREDRSLADDPAQIILSRGFRIAATAVHGETGEKIKMDLYAVISGRGLGKWKLHDNGMLVSPMFAKRESNLRIMQIVANQPILFSSLINVTPDERSRILLRDVKLTKGTRVEGRLDDSINRPVNNGYVTAMVINSGKPNDWDSRWNWRAKTPIAEDGSFVFESLPRDEVLQMIPVCDGWVPAKPTKDAVLKFFPTSVQVLDARRSIPQLVKLEGNQVAATLEMERSTSVRVRVTDPDGKPLAGAMVAMWPNQIWFDGGSQVLGGAYPSRDILVGLRAGNFQYDRHQRFVEKTDDQGVAIIHNLPVSQDESIAVDHDDFEPPISGRDRNLTVILKSGEVAEVQVQMQTKGTDELGQTDSGDNGEGAEKQRDDKQGDESADKDGTGK